MGAEHEPPSDAAQPDRTGRPHIPIRVTRTIPTRHVSSPEPLMERKVYEWRAAEATAGRCWFQTGNQERDRSGVQPVETVQVGEPDGIDDHLPGPRFVLPFHHNPEVGGLGER